MSLHDCRGEEPERRRWRRYQRLLSGHRRLKRSAEIPWSTTLTGWPGERERDTVNLWAYRSASSYPCRAEPDFLSICCESSSPHKGREKRINWKWKKNWATMAQKLSLTKVCVCMYICMQAPLKRRKKTSYLFHQPKSAKSKYRLLLLNLEKWITCKKPKEISRTSKKIRDQNLATEDKNSKHEHMQRELY